MIAERVTSLLDKHWIVTLACHDEHGSWASAVFYVNDGLELYYLSSPASRHCTSLKFDSRLSGAIHENTIEWASIIGLQISGIAKALDATEVGAVRQLYERRFPFVRQTPDQKSELSEALRRAQFYRLSIDHAIIIDNSHGFGQRVEWFHG